MSVQNAAVAVNGGGGVVGDAAVGRFDRAAVAVNGNSAAVGNVAAVGFDADAAVDDGVLGAYFQSAGIVNAAVFRIQGDRFFTFGIGGRTVDFYRGVVGQRVASPAGKINAVTVGGAADDHGDAAAGVVDDVAVFGADRGARAVNADGAGVVDVLVVGPDAGRGVKQVAAVADFNAAVVVDFGAVAVNAEDSRRIDGFGRRDVDLPLVVDDGTVLAVNTVNRRGVVFGMNGNAALAVNAVPGAENGNAAGVGQAAAAVINTVRVGKQNVAAADGNVAGVDHAAVAAVDRFGGFGYLGAR